MKLRAIPTTAGTMTKTVNITMAGVSMPQAAMTSNRRARPPAGRGGFPAPERVTMRCVARVSVITEGAR
ncbi:hypothetical protein GCM10009816_09370 [Microbacterium aquimaris]